MLIDHLNYDESDTGSHTKIVVDKNQILDNKNVAGSLSAPVLFQGVG